MRQHDARDSIFIVASAPWMVEPLTVRLAMGCTGFDKPVLSTVEGLSPNGM